MNILGIETSCDETAVAVVKDLPAGRQVAIEILSNVVASSEKLHAKTGGIIPENAARKQLDSMLPVLTESLHFAFDDSRKDNSTLMTQHIDAIAVTVGPGLIGSLLVGVETAKTLSMIYKKPLIPVNHLVAHLYANWVDSGLEVGTSHRTPKFPAVGLVVSGGHTDFVLMRNHGDITWLGGTRDDAAGEAFDKTARLIGLPYPGGPAISKASENYNDDRLDFFPRPMINSDDLDMSFSGLKTAVLNETKSGKHNQEWYASQIQEAIVDTLVSKSIFAIGKYKPRSFLLSGGVAANSRLREKLTQKISSLKNATALFVPPPRLCTDNGVVIATCAYYNQYKIGWKDAETNPSMAIDFAIL